MQIGVIGSLSIIGLASQFLLFRVNRLQTRSALSVGQGGRRALQLLLQRINFLRKCVNLIFLGLVLQLNILNCLLALI